MLGKPYFGSPDDAVAVHPVVVEQGAARCLVDAEWREMPLPEAGSEVAAFAGLARNGQFESTLHACGLRVARVVAFRDHHPYGARDIRNIAAAAGGLPVVTTEKDLVRLPGELPFRVCALRVAVEFLSGWDSLSRLVLDRIGGAAAR